MKLLYHLGAIVSFSPSVFGAAVAMKYPACPSRNVDPHEQERIFSAFANDFFVQHNTTKALTDYVSTDYIEHNPTAGQGRAAGIAHLNDIGANNPNLNLTIIHQAFSNNTGYVHHYDFSFTPPMKVIDIFRMDGSCIVEHWDIIANLTLGEINPAPLHS